MHTDLEGLSAVVLGGTKGIGRAAVAKLARCGASVVIQGRDAKAAQALIDELLSLIHISEPTRPY